MALQPYRDEDLNFFTFTSLVLNEFPNALRQAFKTMWDNTYGHRPGFQLWDDSTAVRNLFSATEGGRTKVPVHRSYHEWDCTALFQATIYSQVFALHHGTLNDVYVKPLRLSPGHFHPSVVSRTGNNAETWALAIDQLRLLRNSVCHSTSSKMTKVTFDQYVKHVKDSFQALGVSTASIDAVGSLSELDFPVNKVRKLEQGIKEETRSYIKYLEGVNSDIGGLLKKLKGDITSKEDVAMLTRKIDELKPMHDFADNREDITMSARRGGEESQIIADRYYGLGITQSKQGNFEGAHQSYQRALEIRIKLFGEEHHITADCYYSLGKTQRELGDFNAALQSLQHALYINLKLFGEDHVITALCYYSLGETQHKLGYFTSALQSLQLALHILLRLFGEEHHSTADCYYLLGVTQHELGDLKAALQLKLHALEIRIKLFGEEHQSTADCYYSLGITQHKLGDFKAALQSYQRALYIRIKLFGEEHQSTADCYYDLGKTQRKLGDFKEALQSHQRAQDIRIKLIGEEHQAPSEILARGRPAIEAYRRALLEGKGYVRRVPVMIIGQARTGKTSLKKSLKGEFFDPNEGSTEGIETDPSYFKVSTDVWRTSKNSRDTESEPTFSFEHQTAQLIVERLKERKTGSSNAEELSPNTSNAATEPSNAIEEAKEFSNEPSSISMIELSPQDSNSEEPSGEGMTPSRQVSHDHLRVPKLPEDIAALVQRLLEKNRNDKDDIYSIIWDFGGQSVYYDTHPIFLTRKAIYILACNLSYDPYQKADSPTKKGMGGNMDDVCCSKTNLDYLDFWMSSVYSLVRPDVVSQELIVSENLPTVFLACTHADKKSQNANPSKIYDSLKDKVYKELLKGLFVVDNTKSGSGDECRGIKKLREKVLSIAKKFPQMEEAIPLKWLKFEKVLYLLSQEGYKWIPIEKARQIAIDECGIADDEQAIRTLLNFLHDQRVLINFSEPPELKSMVILSPQWLIDVFKEVITVKSWEEVDEDYGELWRSFQKTGILDENLLDHAWRSLVDTQKTDKSILISMMESFNLLCPWPSDGTAKQYLVPSMLPSPPTEDVLKHLAYVRTPSLFVAFDSGRVPPGLFSRLVLQFYRLCQEEWKSKINPELFNNFAMFHILPNRAISLVFMLRSSSIEIVFHVGSDSRDLHTSRAIYSQLKCLLENIRKMSFWLQHMRYELCVCCPVCSEEGSRCRAHDVRGCECLHLLSEVKLRDHPYCDRPGIRGDPTININTFEHWFALSESQGSGIPLSQQDVTQRDNNEEHRITPKKETGLERSTTDPPEVIINQLKNQDLPKNVTHFDDCQLPVDFLLLTVEDCELLSCLSFLNPDFCKTYRSDLGFVYLGDVGEDEKKLNVAVMSCYKGSASPGGSIVVVLNAVKVLRPKAVFCVGSCRSLNYDKVKLGDIVMFEKLITYGPCKITESGIEERGVKVPLKSGLLKVILRAGDGWKPPLKGPKPPEVKIHRGTILSGPVEVIDSPKHCKALVDCFPEAVAMEEEGEGVFAAAHDLDIEWIVIKGISDYAGGSKSKEMSWRPFASLMAASVTAHILSDANVFQDWPHFESTSVEKCRNCESRMKKDAQIPWGRWFDETKINIVVAGLVCLIAVVLFVCFGSN